MAFLMMYPAVAVLSLFVLMVIMLILRFGAKWCKLRHSTFADQEYWNEDEAYEQKVSYASSTGQSTYPVRHHDV